MTNPTPFDLEGSRQERERGLREIERFIEEGDIETAGIAFESIGPRLARVADEAHLVRLRRAAAAVGIEAVWPFEGRAPVPVGQGYLDREPSRQLSEEGIRQLETLIERGDLHGADFKFFLEASELAEGADEAQLARLRKAVEALGIDPDLSVSGLRRGAVAPRF